MIDPFNKEKIMALSWKQPFATAMLYGKIETRTWNTNYRGLVLICTSQKPYDVTTVGNICGDKLLVNMCKAMRNDSGTLDLNGYAIAIGRLVDCRSMRIEDEEKAFVKYRPDLFSHIYEDVRPIKPFPWKGRQGWKTVDQCIYKIEILEPEQTTQP